MHTPTLRDLLENIVNNARVGPDPHMGGSTDAYIVPLEDIDTARGALETAVNSHADLVAALGQIKGELHAALVQRAPSDDAIIMEHIERAHEAARAALERAKASG